MLGYRFRTSKGGQSAYELHDIRLTNMSKAKSDFALGIQRCTCIKHAISDEVDGRRTIIVRPTHFA